MTATAVDTRGAGDPLVLLHGLATTRAIWDHVAPLLAGRRQVVTLDAPGFGGAHPAGRGFDLGEVADRVHRDLRAAGVAEPFDLVGHSMGAAIALVPAERHANAVRSLVLVSPAGLRPLPFAVGARPPHRAGRRAVGKRRPRHPAGGAHTVLRLRPGAVCEVIDRAGHISMVERPAAFAAALERILDAIA